MKHQHIIINVIENQIECTRCGAAYKPSFKQPIENYQQMVNAFTKDHKECPPKEKK